MQNRIKLALYQHDTDQIFVEYFTLSNKDFACSKAKFWGQCAFEGDKVLILTEEGNVWLN